MDRPQQRLPSESDAVGSQHRQSQPSDLHDHPQHDGSPKRAQSSPPNTKPPPTHLSATLTSHPKNCSVADSNCPRSIPSPNLPSPTSDSHTGTHQSPSSPAFTFAAASESQSLDGVAQQGHHHEVQSYVSPPNLIEDFQKLGLKDEGVPPLIASCHRKIPAGFGDSASPFASSGCPSWGGTPGQTPSWNPGSNTPNSFGKKDRGTSESDSHIARFSIDGVGDSKNIEEPETLFACPYRAHSPRVHTTANFPECATKGYKASHNGLTKLRKHINRCHSFPDNYPDPCNYECATCGKGFAEADEAERHPQLRPEQCSTQPRKIGRVRMRRLQGSRILLRDLSWVEKWIKVFCFCFPEIEERDAVGVNCWFVPVIEHFELPQYLFPTSFNQEAASRLSQVEARVCQVVDPIDGQSAEDLADAMAIFAKEVFLDICARRNRCSDKDFCEWVMRRDDSEAGFLAQCRPSGADVRDLLRRRQLSLTSTADMFRRVVRILGETCRQSAVLRNRDSGVSAGGDSGSSEETVIGGGGDQVMTGTYEQVLTVDPRYLTSDGGNHEGMI